MSGNVVKISVKLGREQGHGVILCYFWHKAWSKIMLLYMAQGLKIMLSSISTRP